MLSLASGGQESKDGVNPTKSVPKYDVLKLDVEVKGRIVEKGFGNNPLHKGER